MSNLINATATAAVTKGHPLQRNRYKVELYLDEINTGLEWKVNKRELDGVCHTITTQTQAVLERYGKLDDVMFRLQQREAATKGVKLPAVGATIAVTTDTFGDGPFSKGTVGEVVRSDWSPNLPAEHQYPVSMRPHGAGEFMTIALAVGEWKEL